MNQARASVLPSFTGLNAAVSEARQQQYESNKNSMSSEARQYESNNSSNNSNDNNSGPNEFARQAPHTSVSDTVSDTSAEGCERNPSAGPMLVKSSFGHHGASPTLLLQDTLSPLLEEVDLLFEKSKQIVQSLQAQGNRMQDEDVSV